MKLIDSIIFNINFNNKKCDIFALLNTKKSHLKFKNKLQIKKINFVVLFYTHANGLHRKALNLRNLCGLKHDQP